MRYIPRSPCAGKAGAGPSTRTRTASCAPSWQKPLGNRGARTGLFGTRLWQCPVCQHPCKRLPGWHEPQATQLAGGRHAHSKQWLLALSPAKSTSQGSRQGCLSALEFPPETGLLDLLLQGFQSED